MLRIFLIAGMVVGLLAGCGPGSNTAGKDDHESAAFHRVRESGVLHCGYAVWPAGLMKDDKTGAFSGMMVDFMNEVGRVANIKIVWDHEVDWGQMREEFESGKIDAMCASDWIQAHKIRQVYYSDPFAYDTVTAIVRNEDNRFNGNLVAANKADITICAMENDASDILARENFPQAKRQYIAPMETQETCLTNVATGKADVTFMDTAVVDNFLKQGDAPLKTVPDVKPVAVYPLGIPLAHGDNDMVQLFNTAILQMQAEGFLDRLIDKYRKLYPSSFYKLDERQQISR